MVWGVWWGGEKKERKQEVSLILIRRRVKEAGKTYLAKLLLYPVVKRSPLRFSSFGSPHTPLTVSAHPEANMQIFSILSHFCLMERLLLRLLF